MTILIKAKLIYSFYILINICTKEKIISNLLYLKINIFFYKLNVFKMF